MLAISASNRARAGKPAPFPYSILGVLDAFGAKFFQKGREGHYSFASGQNLQSGADRYNGLTVLETW